MKDLTSGGIAPRPNNQQSIEMVIDDRNIKELIPPYVREEPHISGRFFINQKGHWFFVIDENTVDQSKTSNPVVDGPVILPWNSGDYGMKDGDLVHGRMHLRVINHNYSNTQQFVYQLIGIRNPRTLAPVVSPTLEDGVRKCSIEVDGVQYDFLAPVEHLDKLHEIVSRIESLNDGASESRD